ncbi:hypothetical protein GCM10028771_06030 [Nocardioides marmoraquaticus]
MSDLTLDDVYRVRCNQCGTLTSPWSCSCGSTRVTRLTPRGQQQTEPTPVRQSVAEFLVDVLHDAWVQGDRAFWLKRAEQFAEVGTPSCDEIAQACRNRADLTSAADVEFRDTLLAFLRQANTD